VLPRGDHDDAGPDPLHAIPDPAQAGPLEMATLDESTDVVLRAIERLPMRQQQAFLLRAWEGLDVKSTAFAMRCSEGSVKTHYSRALKSLRAALEM
jgi:RNA polymerase sigma-70 factor (ECF subfamily)